MRGRWTVWTSRFVLLLGVFLGGCGPKLSERDLGTVIYELPKVPGAEKPYQMPQLGLPSENDISGDTK